MPHGYLFLALLLTLSLAAGRDDAGDARTVPGPETKALLPATAGYLVRGRGPGGIVALQLPTLQEIIVRPTYKDATWIHAVSGPDRGGRIAFIADHALGADKHTLKTIKLDGSQETELFSRPGSALWAGTAAGKGEIGKHLALSPVKGRIVMLTGLSSLQMHNPQVLLEIGSLEIWDANEKTGKKTDIQAMDDSMAWFPDGKRLAYTEMIDRKEIPAAGIPGDDTFGKDFKHWGKVPAVFIHDFDAATDTLLQVGWRPAVSSDGQFVLVGDWEDAFQRVDVQTGKSQSATWPGAYPRLVAYPRKDIVLSWGLPTAGAKIEYTKGNSPLVGPKQMLTIKLARMNTSEFQTVVPSIDPRDVVSFGQVDLKQGK
jgi:hypothetical protein